MRRIPIVSITPSGSNPGFITVDPTPDNPSGDWSQVFQGKFYRDAGGATQPFYSSPTPPAGYVLIQATTFSVIDNPSYAGRYTVYTQPSALGQPSSTYGAGKTVIRVNEPVGAPQAPADATAGFITNVSTYFITVPPASPIIVPPETIIEDKAVDLPGRSFSGWGEVLLQNLARQVQSFAGATAPPVPFVGQVWYSTSNGEFRVWSGSAWSLLNGTVFATAASFKHAQTVSAQTWTISHNLDVPAPFIVHASFFVDVGGGSIKPILPSDVTYIDANQLSVTFSTTYSGYALIRP